MPSVRYGVYPLYEEDRPALEAHFLRLDPESRRRRFGVALPDEGVRRLVAQLPLGQHAWGVYIWGELKGTAFVLPYKAQPWRGEFAITLGTSLRGRGWGKMLTQTALETAYMEGRTEVDVFYLSENTPMQRICARYPGPMERDGGDCHKTIRLEQWADDALAPQLLMAYGQ